MGENWQCWRCGTDLTDIPRPYGRHAQCPSCRADLHVCLMCRHHDIHKAKQCRERAADEVMDKTRANLCEWFQARPGAHVRGADKADDSTRAKLDALFGADPAVAPAAGRDSPRRALDDLFGGNE